MFDGKLNGSAACPAPASPSAPCRMRLAPFYTAGRGGSGAACSTPTTCPRAALLLRRSRSTKARPATPSRSRSAEGPASPTSAAAANLGLWRGLGALHRTARRGDGHLRTPYEVFGMLSYQMWRAARLVVDTGVHAKGWTPRTGDPVHARQHGALHEVTTEVDRYISWPGQALSYYLGEMTIAGPRKGQERQLGSQVRHPLFPRRDTGARLGAVARARGADPGLHRRGGTVDPAGGQAPMGLIRNSGRRRSSFDARGHRYRARR